MARPPPGAHGAVTLFPRDARKYPVPTFFLEIGGTTVLSVNDDSPDNTPVTTALLSGAPTGGSSEVIALLLATIPMRFQTHSDDDSYATAASMAAEGYLPANLLFPVPVTYPARRTITACAADSSLQGDLYIMLTDDA